MYYSLKWYSANAIPFFGGYHMKIRRCLAIIVGFFLFVILVDCIQVKAYDPNMDGGGGGGGSQNGTSENYYSSGDDGVRLTVIEIETGMRAVGSYSIDYFRKSKENKSITHFGKISKIEYMGVAGYSSSKNLSQSSEGYRVNREGVTVAFQVEEMPTIVSSSSGNSDIEKIKSYFNNEDRLRKVASRVGMTYDELISGRYKLIIEPIIYLTFNSRYMAMTAHEAAKLDMALGGTSTNGGQLRAKFVSFTHKNLPLSIFLKKKELGVKNWTGSKYDRVNNGQILTYLGIGILSFEPEELETDVESFDFDYRPDTDVITYVDVGVGSGGNGATSDNPITVTFSGELIDTKVVTGIVIPPGGSRPVWIKWHTPKVKEPDILTSTINVSVSGGSASNATIKVKVKPIARIEPPNPSADDTRKSTWSDNILPNFPKLTELKSYTAPVKTRSWHTYTCRKKSVWFGDYYTDEDGNEHKIYVTVYEFDENNYTASLTSTKAVIMPDMTVRKSNPANDIMKSGYGIELKVTSNVSGSSSSFTGMQNAVVYFPEFEYKWYRRIGTTPGANLTDIIEFPVNVFSLRGNRVHFLPIWFPDKEYKVYIETLDAWTPAGMLCDYITTSINVKGSLWDDYHLGVIPDLP